LKDFHSVKILETVVRQSEVRVHRKKCLFCKVTPVSIHTFVEGLLRLANVLEATNIYIYIYRTVCGVIFNVRISKYFGLKNSVFYIWTLLTENNRFLCIFSVTLFSQLIFYYCIPIKMLQKVYWQNFRSTNDLLQCLSKLDRACKD
jgi:hypothetical protein